ncbi:hypothetical protein FQN54_006156 [Arachnomyces sp. PD_36]|nr:hypothetical protein FQN54_006156 [Arachnomyces sp. PD_36]
MSDQQSPVYSPVSLEFTDSPEMPQSEASEGTEMGAVLPPHEGGMGEHHVANPAPPQDPNEARIRALEERLANLEHRTNSDRTVANAAYDAMERSFEAVHNGMDCETRISNAQRVEIEALRALVREQGERIQELRVLDGAWRVLDRSSMLETYKINSTPEWESPDREPVDPSDHHGDVLIDARFYRYRVREDRWLFHELYCMSPQQATMLCLQGDWGTINTIDMRATLLMRGRNSIPEIVENAFQVFLGHKMADFRSCPGDDEHSPLSESHLDFWQVCDRQGYVL